MLHAWPGWSEHSDCGGERGRTARGGVLPALLLANGTGCTGGPNQEEKRCHKDARAGWRPGSGHCRSRASSRLRKPWLPGSNIRRAKRAEPSAGKRQGSELLHFPPPVYIIDSFDIMCRRKTCQRGLSSPTTASVRRLTGSKPGWRPRVVGWC